MQTSVVREYAKILDDQTMMPCIVKSWPDFEFAVNDVKSVHEDSQSFVTSTGFE